MVAQRDGRAVAVASGGNHVNGQSTHDRPATPIRTVRGTTSRRARRLGAAALVLPLGLAAGLVAMPAASADTAPPDAGTPATVSVDALPTVQVNGVVWQQVTVGNTVYATGKFTSARPPGAAAGTGETPRSNLLAYDITTGQLITSFNHSLNAQGLAITASPDGSTIYVGGDFTTVDGVSRPRLAAFSTATGAVKPFTSPVNGQVRALSATNSAVYAGGNFTSVGTAARSRLAAFDTAGGCSAGPPAPTTSSGPSS